MRHVITYLLSVANLELSRPGWLVVMSVSRIHLLRFVSLRCKPPFEAFAHRARHELYSAYSSPLGSERLEVSQLLPARRDT